MSAVALASSITDLYVSGTGYRRAVRGSWYSRGGASMDPGSVHARLVLSSEWASARLTVSAGGKHLRLLGGGDTVVCCPFGAIITALSPPPPPSWWWWPIHVSLVGLCVWGCRQRLGRASAAVSRAFCKRPRTWGYQRATGARWYGGQMPPSTPHYSLLAFLPSCTMVSASNVGHDSRVLQGLLLSRVKP